MSARQANPEALFDRPWRPGHPFRPRLSRGRRWGMLGLLALFTVLIWGYLYVTDSKRVKQMAESYLSEVLGGRVEVGGATLSIFQGLRLDNVKVLVDDDAAALDAVVFSARSFVISYDPSSIVRGRLAATEIAAIEPRIHLVENRDTGRRNYQRLRPERAPETRPTGPVRPMVLPEIRLRNAQIEYSEISGGRYRAVGSMQIEGRLWPGTEANEYQFSMQSRGEREGIGPVVKGVVSMADGRVWAALSNFEFSQDILAMLPAEVRRWWEEHELSGRVDVPQLSYTPARDGQGGHFRVETSLNGVSLSVQPREWLSRAENRRLARIREAADLLRRVGMNLGGDVDQFAAVVEPAPVKLENVAGTFVFTDDGIDVQNLTGRVETNALRISGRIDGYSPEAPARLRIASSETENIYIPRSPRYVRSLPPEVRELYEHLRPEGTCSLWVEVSRATAGAKPAVRGEVTVLEGKFVFDEFPYPLRDATGRITFGPDGQTGQDRCDIKDLRGLGIRGGPNQDVAITINGWVAPLGDGAEVKVRVAGSNVVSEEALRQAFPPEVRDVLKMFDPDGQGRFPQFRGKFACDVHRPRGYRTKWAVGVDVTLEDAAGAFEVFPYPLEKVRGELEIGDDVVRIKQVTGRHGGATVLIDGQVGFGKNKPLTPALSIIARDVPLDETFLAAMPAEQREWVKQVGLGGVLNIDGKVYRADVGRGQRVVGSEGATTHYPLPTTHPSSGITYDLDMSLRDGVIFRAGEGFALTQFGGRGRLTPRELVLHELTAKRGEAPVSGEGALVGLDGRPRLKLSARAKGLALDESLYKLLSAGAQAAWDQVQPWGTVDAELMMDQVFGEAGASTQPTTQVATTQPVATTQRATTQQVATTRPAPRFELALRPVKLSVVPRAVPYRLDDLSGQIVIRPDEVKLIDLAAKHGETKVRLSGTGGTEDGSVWDLKLAADDAPVDDDLRTAVPESLRNLIDVLKLKGRVSFAFDRLAYRTVQVPPKARVTTGTAASPASTRPTTEADVDWHGTVALKGASMEAGVPLTEVAGGLDLSGSIRAGRLAELGGTIDLPGLKLAGRDMKHLRAELVKPPDQAVMQLGKVNGELAGGSFAGQIDFAFPDDAPSTYAINMVLRNADVRELAQTGEKDLKGQLTASLALEGQWDDTSRRRGRGDVSVEGKEMYKIPVVLGLLQITNLSLPISRPFDQATARYSVEGNKVAFESIELRSDLMTMQGSGGLDFGTKKVKMTFVTDNPNALKVPFLTELLQGVKQELFQIHVNGTIEEPKVGPILMNTFTTTVDEVFKGTDPGGKKKK